MDTSAMLGGALHWMKAAGSSMPAMTESAHVAASGYQAQATVATVAETAIVVNMQPPLRIDVTVMPDGPHPASVTQVVPLHMAKAKAGNLVRLRVDQTDPRLAWIDREAA